MSIQEVNSAPKYISNFINHNIEQLNKIYEEGIQIYKIGILGFKCSEKNNKMDVQFMNEEHICESLQKESWENLKNSIPKNKKLFFIMDEDANNIFLIYI